MTPAKGAIATLCIRAISICAQLGFFVLLARSASIEVVGIFAVASAVWVLARALLPMGWNVAVLRSVSVLRAESNFHQGVLILKAALLETAVLGTLLAGMTTLGTVLLSQEQTLDVALASLVAVLWAGIGIFVSYLRALGDLIWSQACDGVVVYAIPLAACAVMSFAGLTVEFTVIAATYVASAVLSLLLLFVAVHRRREMSRDTRPSITTHPTRRRWARLIPTQRRLARRLWWNQAFSAVSGRISVMMAAPMAGVATTAIVETGLRTQLVGATLAWAGGTVASPKYAVAHEKKTGEGPRILNVVTWAAILPSVLVVALLIVWGEPILGVLGPAYVAERWAITIMAIAAVVELPAASGGYFLMMTGRERVANSSTVLQLLVVVLLILILGPSFGATGIAFAVLVASVVRSTVVLISLQKDEVMSPMAGRGLLTLGSQIALRLRPRS